MKKNNFKEYIIQYFASFEKKMLHLRNSDFFKDISGYILQAVIFFLVKTGVIFDYLTSQCFQPIINLIIEEKNKNKNENENKT